MVGLVTKPRHPSSNWQYLFLFSTIFGGSFLVFFINNASDVLYVGNELGGGYWDAPRYRLTDNPEAYSIKTAGCSIPALDPYDSMVRKYVFYPEDAEECAQGTSMLLESNSSHIWVRREHLSSYNVTEDSEFSCCYSAFYRPKYVTDINSKSIDNRVKYEECVTFLDSIQISDEFVYVSCSDRTFKVYEDYFATPILKNFNQNPDSTETTPAENATGFNVLILGIDAVSRMNFYRTMPKTLANLKQLKAVELMGYNKVGDNTFPNLVPVLMGIPEHDLKKTCHPKKDSTFDNCPFLWDWFKEAGYVTAFAEDSASIGTFNYFQVGFGGSPTDYYLYTFIHEAEKNIGRNKDFNSYLCMGSKYFYQVLQEYIINLANKVKSLKYFGFFWETTMSHDYLNYPMLMDKSYDTFLRKMNKLGHLNRTVLILMSDHGIRWGDIRQTKQGRMEERLPFVYMLLPPQFREVYNEAYNNLLTNSRQLTTPFDLHETLVDLKDLTSLENENIARRAKTAYATARGISLFLPVPGNRTCAAAHIDDHWCTCHKSRKVDKRDGRVLEAVSYLVRWINDLVRDHRHCARLALSEVVEANEVEMSDSALENVKHTWRDYTVVVRVAPSDAVFEATVRRSQAGEWSLAGSVSRLNLYGEQSRCVDEYHLKLYCYCR